MNGNEPSEQALKAALEFVLSKRKEFVGFEPLAPQVKEREKEIAEVAALLDQFAAEARLEEAQQWYATYVEPWRADDEDTDIAAKKRIAALTARAERKP